MDHLEYLETQSGNSTHGGSQLCAFDTESGLCQWGGGARVTGLILWGILGKACPVDQLWSLRRESWHVVSLGAVS